VIIVLKIRTTYTFFSHTNRDIIVITIALCADIGSRRRFASRAARPARYDFDAPSDRCCAARLLPATSIVGRGSLCLAPKENRRAGFDVRGKRVRFDTPRAAQSRLDADEIR